MKKIFLLSFMLMLIINFSTSASTRTWDGSSSTSWTNQYNWSGNSVPGQSDDVIIPGGLSRYPVISDNSTHLIKSLTIQSGASLTMNTSGPSSSSYLVIYSGNWVNNGTFNAVTGEVRFRIYGQTLSGSGSTTFNNLRISIGATVQLQQSITVNGTLYFTNTLGGTTYGTLKTYSNTVTLGPSGSIDKEYPSGIDTSSYPRSLIGNLITTRNVGTGTSTFGNIGFSIDNTGDNLGNVTVIRVSGTAPAGSGSKLNRSWTVSSVNPPTSGRNITFSWLPDDEGDVNLLNAVVYKSTNDGTDWSNVGIAQNASNDTITAVGITSFSLWTVGDADNPLPVELSSFSAAVNNNAVVLSWVTKTEKNNYGFNVEKKVGDNWGKIGFVQGSGNSNSPKNYFFSDKASNGTFSYRLKQINTDGSYQYSDPISVEVSSKPMKYNLANYPNPFNPETKIQFELPRASHVNLSIYNIVGERVATLVNENMEAGVYQKTFSSNSNYGQLSSGIYFYRLTTDNGVNITKKMVLAK
jgi:hypothetical protein